VIIIELDKYPFSTLEGLRAVRGQIEMLRDLGMRAVAANMEHMADDLEVVLRAALKTQTTPTRWVKQVLP
jgi:hypothetical protein